MKDMSQGWQMEILVVFKRLVKSSLGWGEKVSRWVDLIVGALQTGATDLRMIRYSINYDLRASNNAAIIQLQ